MAVCIHNKTRKKELPSFKGIFSSASDFKFIKEIEKLYTGKYEIGLFMLSFITGRLNQYIVTYISQDI